MSMVPRGNSVRKSVENLARRRRHIMAEGRAVPLVSCGAESISPGRLGACSACAGDYEDPDRTAWTPDLDDEDGADDTNRASGGIDRGDEFPAKET